MGRLPHPAGWTTVLNDPVWAVWGRHVPIDSNGPAWPVVVAMQSALTLLLAGQAHALAGLPRPAETTPPFPRP
ncbi:hypothetical protein GCM10010219_09530 [Streptomyces netropsis]|nr:hypothetical protein GCM10010219_09530 [Streptomyces netropsis]